MTPEESLARALYEALPSMDEGSFFHKDKDAEHWEGANLSVREFWLEVAARCLEAQANLDPLFPLDVA